MKRTAIYIRVSTEQQIDKDSIPAQRSALRTYIDGRADLLFAGEYMDDGISGTKYSNRDELQRLLDDVKAGNIDLIIFTKLDRWFRSVRHYTATQEILDRHNVGWLAIWEPIYDTTTPQGRLIVHQMLAIAQFEAENTGQRIRQVFGYKLSQGEVLSGKIPPGYSIVDKHLVPNDDAPYVLECFEDYARTSNLFETMSKWSGTHGMPITRNQLKRMLQNPLYKGEHRTGLKGFCDPIVSDDLWDDVQRKLSMNVKKSQKRTYIFTGLLKCSDCGYSYGGYPRKYKYYRCPHHWNFKPRRCPNSHYISEARIEKYLVKSIPEMARQCVIEYERAEGPKKSREEQITVINRKIDRLKELFVNDLITLDEYKADKEALVKQLDEIAAQEAPQADYSALEALANMNVAEIYGTLTEAEKRRFWRGIIKTIWYGSDKEIRVEFL